MLYEHRSIRGNVMFVCKCLRRCHVHVLYLRHSHAHVRSDVMFV